MSKGWFRPRLLPWLLVLVMLLSAGVASLVLRRRSASSYDLEALTVPVESAALTVRINASGEVEPVQTVNLSPKTSGIVAELLVEQGDRVEQNQVVARMDTDDLSAQLRQAEASLAEAQAQLADLQQGAPAPQLGQAQANLQAVKAQLADAEAQLQLAQSNFRRDRALYDQGAISERDLDSAQNALDAAQATVAQTEARVSEAQQRFNDVADDPDPEEVAQAQARVSQARAQRDIIRTRIGNTVVRAPFAGTVTQKFATIGAFVTPTTAASDAASATSSAIVAIADGLEVVAEIPEADIGQIRVGQTAEITTAAYPEAVYQGQVRLIAPEAIERQNVTIFQVRVSLASGLEQLRPNMNVDVDFLGNRLTDALVVPAVAVVTQGGENGVLVPGEKGAIRFRPVTLGSQIDDQIQILDGVTAGDRVFIDLPPGQTLDNLRFNRDEVNS